MIDNNASIISQYNSLKQRNLDKIILFKIGSFYEIFGLDVKKISQVLNIKETIKLCDKEKIPMCGFPVKNKTEYIKKLMEKGFSVVIVDEEVKKENKKYQRFVSDIITPSTSHLNADLSYSVNACYITSMAILSKNVAILFIDISTGEAFIEYTKIHRDSITKKLLLYGCKEILISEDFTININIDGFNVITISEDLLVINENINNITGGHLLTNKEKKLFWQIFGYIANINPSIKFTIDWIEKRYNQNQIYIPTSTLLSLSIISEKNNDKNTLLNVLDYTLTAMGKRFLYAMLLKVTNNNIQERLNFIEYFLLNEDAFNDLKIMLYDIGDVDRMIFRIINEKMTEFDIINFIISITRMNKLLIFICNSELILNIENTITSLVSQVFELLCIQENEILELKSLSKKNIIEITALISKHSVIIKKNSNLVGFIDALFSLTTASKANQWIKPIIVQENIIEIKQGYHVIYKNIFPDKEVVKNDFISNESNKTIIITGVNMSGKSVYLKQIGLICFMSQIGCFVPCDSMKIGRLNSIISRIGSWDAMQDGKSTFYIELEEVADMVNNADVNSLCLIDELGRGASFEDGIEVATRVLTYLHKYTKTTILCSSHINEIAKLENTLNGLKNFHFEAFINKNGEIKFSYKLKSGINQNASILKQIGKMVGIPGVMWNF